MLPAGPIFVHIGLARRAREEVVQVAEVAKATEAKKPGLRWQRLPRSKQQMLVRRLYMRVKKTCPEVLKARLRRLGLVLQIKARLRGEFEVLFLCIK